MLVNSSLLIFAYQAEIVMKQKMELINQIKEMELGRDLRQKMVDLTESSGCGLLCEMSIAEVWIDSGNLTVKDTIVESGVRFSIFSEMYFFFYRKFSTLDKNLSLINVQIVYRCYYCHIN